MIEILSAIVLGSVLWFYLLKPQKYGDDWSDTEKEEYNKANKEYEEYLDDLLKKYPAEDRTKKNN